MEKEEGFNITNAKIVVDNFKTKEDRRSCTKRFGTSMFGKDKLSKIFVDGITKEKTGFVMLKTGRISDKGKISNQQTSSVFLMLLTLERRFC